MPQPRDVPTDLEWFRALEFSPDDLDEDPGEFEGNGAPSMPRRADSGTPAQRKKYKAK